MNRPATVYKPGRDVTVGDVLPRGPGGFLILAFAEHWRVRRGPRPSCGCWRLPRRRMAMNCWGEGIVVFDDRPTRVLGRRL